MISKKIDRLFVIGILIAMILPIIHIGRFGMPVLYLLMPIELVLLVWIYYKKYQRPKIFDVVIIMFTLIVVEILVSTTIGTILTLGYFSFPFDIFQYLARGLVFVLLFYFAYYGEFNSKSFIKYLLIIMNIGMIIGILQWIPWSGRELIIRLYPFRDGSLQLSQMNRSLANYRLHGIAQHATANGGLASFFMLFGISELIYYRKFKFLSLFLIGFSFINVIASQSRAGILVLVVAFFLFFFVNVLVFGNFKKQIKFFLGFMLVTLLVITLLYFFDNPFVTRMVYRWDVLINTSGGGRVDQIKYFADNFDSVTKYLFGLSKQVVNVSRIPHGIEVEVLNIFVLYGLIGWVLHYGLVLFLLRYFFLKIRVKDVTIRFFSIVSFITLLSYQVFAISHYFFREIRVGLIPWILIAFSIGVIERKLRNANS